MYHVFIMIRFSSDTRNNDPTFIRRAASLHAGWRLQHFRVGSVAVPVRVRDRVSRVCVWSVPARGRASGLTRGVTGPLPQLLTRVSCDGSASGPPAPPCFAAVVLGGAA